MTLLWTAEAEHALQALQREFVGTDHYGRLVRRLVQLENDASTFEALFEPIVHGDAVNEQLSRRRIHVLEADPGFVYLVVYRLVLTAEDVLIERLGRSQ